ncbi:MAG: dTDP-4-dehydrorhamnose 3,5-epimerase family protein [Alphaproteobacteria bacterium]
MKVTRTSLDGVLAIEPPTMFEDFRGQYVELYNRGLYQQAGITVDFPQDDISVSSRHVLRGIHGDQTTWKLVCCLYGRFYLVVVNWDETSPQYRRWEGFTLSDRNRLQILIPPKFGNGHLILSDTAIFHYKQSTLYDRDSQFTIRWDDPQVNAYWPVKDPILSIRDSSAAGH